MRFRVATLAVVLVVAMGTMGSALAGTPGSRGTDLRAPHPEPGAAVRATSRAAPGGQVVLKTPADEWRPILTPGYFIWCANDANDPDDYDVLVKPYGKPKFEVNGPDTVGWLGGADGTKLVYQSVYKRQSDIKFFDLGTKVRWNPPSGVNTRAWEMWPSVSGDWLLFTREVGGFYGEWRVILFNTTTGEKRVLASLQHTDKNELLGTQVNGNYAVWYQANFTAGGDSDVFVYDIEAEKTTKVPDVASERYPSVSSDGIVYFRRWQNSRAHLMLYRVSDRSTKAILTLSSGYDLWSTHPFTKDGTTYLYFDPDFVSTDGPQPSDIYRVKVSG